jgi:hypothetical protein
MNPVETDAKLAELYAQESALRTKYDRIQHSLRDGFVRSYTEQDATDAFNALRKVIEQELPLEAEYERAPWPRYWHVTNVNGHIHTSMACSSCFPDTQYAWRTDLSGLTDIEVVECEAHNACTVCMPIAPAEQRVARERYNAEQRAERKAERTAKATEKLRKAALRAQKLMVKVEAAYAALGGHEAVMALPQHGPGSAYALTSDLQTTVANVIYDDVQEFHGGRRFNRDPRGIIAEAQAEGLV